MATATLAATDLRAELKEWERAFSAANGGRKAGRHDIKNNPDIGMLTGLYSFRERLANTVHCQPPNTKPTAA